MNPILTKALAIALVSILMIVMVAPQPALAQGGLLSGITGILSGLNGATAALQNFINNVMRPILQAISTASSAVQNILSTLRNFFEQVVWPISEINRIRGLVQQLIAQFSGALNTLYGINVASTPIGPDRSTVWSFCLVSGVYVCKHAPIQWLEQKPLNKSDSGFREQSGISGP